MVFMIGIYWCARSPETETTSMRLWRPTGVSVFSMPDAAGLDEVSISENMMVALFMYERPRVSAPAI